MLWLCFQSLRRITSLSDYNCFTIKKKKRNQRIFKLLKTITKAIKMQAIVSNCISSWTIRSSLCTSTLFFCFFSMLLRWNVMHWNGMVQMEEKREGQVMDAITAHNDEINDSEHWILETQWFIPFTNHYKIIIYFHAIDSYMLTQFFALQAHKFFSLSLSRHFTFYNPKE